ncbi:hypothetical protein CQR46_1216 [Bifidobacterium pseudolongum subsp. globosum]|uniref:Uncharacterized protein n=1 Tax=Bifidobacterium pseudolongum subsp. globosum TaxID=1690 RepID=A0A2N3QGE5_9BIFI|nr:hypothetical protein [Bifidobacterium pseudolongum]PKU90213.1 hypothetical protein CQR46_1216 [Bifidobacterium pseudolongum subsp. globosum]PKV05042.1 hypothetical protein CQR50_0296 [Bifidobacterium pseudolongum subsp. globosum]
MDRNNNVSIEQIAAMPAVRQAAQTGEELVGLWPLTSAAHMGNDAQYAENLQVRLSRTLAQVMTGEVVSMPDAEFVYEGAESIPGRPQSIVDALLAANDALDGLSEPETPQLLEMARTLGIEWDEQTQTAVAKTVDGALSAQDGGLDGKPFAWRFAAVIALFDELMHAALDQTEAQLGGTAAPHSGGAPTDRVMGVERLALPFVPFANAYAEAIGVPGMFMTAEQYHGIVAAYATPNGSTDAEDSAAVLAQVLGPLAAAEWRKHREDVLWDPAEAKKRAKEEDERKNKEALAAKFAHIKDDPTKPAVEL